MVWDYSGSSNETELHQKLCNIMVRRLKSAVLTELPPKQRSIVPVVMDADYNNACEEAMQALDATDAFRSDSDAASAFGSHQTTITKAYQMTGIGKARSAAAYLVDWLAGSQEKILVFCHHAAVMDTIEKALFETCPNSHVRIDGKTQNAVRGQLVHKFQTCQRIRVALLSMTAAGVGLTLTAAATVLFVELHWTPGILAQAEDRVHRIGQTHNSVQIIYMICKEKRQSLDLSLWRMLGRKIGTVESVVDGKTCAPYLYAASESGQAPMVPQSGQNELAAFFAESSADERVQSRPKPSVKGSILSFFETATPVSLSDAEPLTKTTEVIQGKRDQSAFTHARAKKKLGRTKVEPAVASEPWACDHCTFVNPSGTSSKDQRCSVCANERWSARSSSACEDITYVVDSPVIRPPENSRRISSVSETRRMRSDVNVCGTEEDMNSFVSEGDIDSESDLDEFFCRPFGFAKKARTAANNQSGLSCFLGKSSESQYMSWTCASCTLDNKQSKRIDDDYACDACDTVWRPLRSVLQSSTSTLLRKESASFCTAKRVSLDNGIVDELPMRKMREVITIDSSSDEEDVCEEPSPAHRSRSKECTASARTTTESAPATPPIMQVFNFSVSKNTGRITVHHASTGATTYVSFDVNEVVTDETADRMLDGRVKHASMRVQEQTVDFDEDKLDRLYWKLCSAIGQSTVTMKSFGKMVEGFVRPYVRLRETEKRALAEHGEPVLGPEMPRVVAGLIAGSFSSNARYVGGAKERAAERVKQGLASERDEAVLSRGACVWSGMYLQDATLQADGIYCSQACGDEGRLRRGGVFASRNLRTAVFALEAGVCTRCGFDTHRLYEDIRGLEPAQRLNRFMNAKWKLPNTRNALDNLLSNPKEGDFWQVDHIRAVSEGGGGCGLENLRTLCVPCHQQETDDLRRRLRLRAPAGSAEERGVQADITNFFPHARLEEEANTR